jgi:hypothetical protein
MEPVIDHLGDLLATLEGAVEHVVIDPVLGEQFGKGLAVAALDRPS